MTKPKITGAEVDCENEHVMGCKRHKRDLLQFKAAADQAIQQHKSGASAGTRLDATISTAEGFADSAPSFIYMPHIVLYQVCKHTGDSSILSPLLGTCKTWRATVQSAVKRLSMGSVSQVRTCRRKTISITTEANP